MNRNKWLGIVFVYLLFAIVFSGCAATAEAVVADRDVLNLFPGTTRWISSEGDILVQTFRNASTGVVVHTRALAGGYAVTCELQACPETVVGYLMNGKTFSEFRTWLVGSGGFVQVARSMLPAMPMPTLFVMPAALFTPLETGDIFGFLKEDG